MITKREMSFLSTSNMALRVEMVFHMDCVAELIKHEIGTSSLDYNTEYNLNEYSSICKDLAKAIYSADDDKGVGELLLRLTSPRNKTPKDEEISIFTIPDNEFDDIANYIYRNTTTIKELTHKLIEQSKKMHDILLQNFAGWGPIFSGMKYVVRYAVEIANEYIDAQRFVIIIKSIRNEKKGGIHNPFARIAYYLHKRLYVKDFADVVVFNMYHGALAELLDVKMTEDVKEEKNGNE